MALIILNLRKKVEDFLIVSRNVSSLLRLLSLKFSQFISAELELSI